MGWDRFQRDVLAGLGHQLYVLQRADAPAGEAVADVPAVPPLLAAIARAAGMDPRALPPLPPAETLRTPAGKRALWPRLRALRRSRR